MKKVTFIVEVDHLGLADVTLVPYAVKPDGSYLLTVATSIESAAHLIRAQWSVEEK